MSGEWIPWAGAAPAATMLLTLTVAIMRRSRARPSSRPVYLRHR
ncbi:MAG: hypothetical protein H6R08_1050 [Proteobacteria bacterium]|jgi:hypothetical protein|nr:hypothetical protein [Pseudomonadota bacterium]